MSLKLKKKQNHYILFLVKKYHPGIKCRVYLDLPINPMFKRLTLAIVAMHTFVLRTFNCHELFDKNLMYLCSNNKNIHRHNFGKRDFRVLKCISTTVNFMKESSLRV